MPELPPEPKRDRARRQAIDSRRYTRDARIRHGADAWIVEWLAPLRDARIAGISVGEASDIATFCLRHLREDRAPQIASALSFRTLFGLVPVLVVATLIARVALGTNFIPAVEKLLVSAGLSEIHLSIPTADGETPTIGLDSWLMQLITFAQDLNITALGWTGFVLVVFSAVWVLVTIEEAFNVIFRCQHGRSWMRRVLVYWFVLTIGPLLLGLAPVFFQRLDGVGNLFGAWEWMAALARFLISLVMLWAVLLIAYTTIPATRVAWRPAMIGALVSAVLLEIGKRTFGLYLAKAFGVSALYGSLGLIPLFMFWVYLMWLVILFGAEIAALLQAIRGRDRLEHDVPDADSEAALRAVAAVANEFEVGGTLSLPQIAHAARVPASTALFLLGRLEDVGIVRRLGEEDEFTLARPPNAVAVETVLGVAWQGLDGGAQPTALEEKLRSAQRSAVRGMTLCDL